jgi:hypothetical protein
VYSFMLASVISFEICDIHLHFWLADENCIILCQVSTKLHTKIS